MEIMHFLERCDNCTDYTNCSVKSKNEAVVNLRTQGFLLQFLKLLWIGFMFHRQEPVLI